MGFPALRPRKKEVPFIHNPHSGKNTPRYGYGKILADIISTPRYTYGASTLNELKSATREIHSLRSEIIGFCGGDGTLSLDLTRILREWAKTPSLPLPKILYFPTGTRCVVAENLGLMEHSADEFAKRIRYKIDHNLPFETAHLNPLKINDQYGFMYGVGMPASAVQHYYDKADYGCVDGNREYGLEEVLAAASQQVFGGDKAVKPPCRFTCRWDKASRYDGRCPKCGRELQRILGNKRFNQVVVEALWDEIRAKLLFRQSHRLLTKPAYAEIALPDGHEPPFAPYLEYTGIMCSTIESMGNHCRAMPLARQKPDHFMLRCMNLGFWGIVRMLPFLWSGMALPTGHAFDAVVPNLTIKFKDDTVRTIDGDLGTSRCDHLGIGPALEFIVG